MILDNTMTMECLNAKSLVLKKTYVKVSNTLIQILKTFETFTQENQIQFNVLNYIRHRKRDFIFADVEKLDMIIRNLLTCLIQYIQPNMKIEAVVQFEEELCDDTAKRKSNQSKHLHCNRTSWFPCMFSTKVASDNSFRSTETVLEDASRNFIRCGNILIKLQKRLIVSSALGVDPGANRETEDYGDENGMQRCSSADPSERSLLQFDSNLQNLNGGEGYGLAVLLTKRILEMHGAALNISR